jgi:Methyltransferase domain
LNESNGSSTVLQRDGIAMDQAELMAELRARVEERRAAGEYPPGLEEDLDRHFQAVVASRGRSRDRLLQLLARARAAAAMDRSLIPLDSRLPMGELVHRSVGRVVARQTDGVIDQVEAYAAAVQDLLAAVIDDLPDESPADLEARVDYLLDRVAAYDRVAPGAPAEVKALARRVEFLEALLGAPTDPIATPPVLPGDRVDVDQVVAAAAGATPVMVLHCGRGEVMAALAAASPGVTGVDRDVERVEAVVRRGLAAVVAEPLAHLEAAEDGSLGAVVLGVAAESVDGPELPAMVVAAARALRAQGRLIAWGGAARVAGLGFAAGRAGFAAVDVDVRGRITPALLTAIR